MIQKNDEEFDEFIEELELSGSQLKKFREFIGLSQQEVADRMKVDRTTITKQEGQQMIAKRFLRQFFGSLNEYDVGYIQSILEGVKDDAYTINLDDKNVLNKINNKGNKMDSDNYFEKKTLMSDAASLRETDRLRSESDRQKETIHRKEMELYEMKTYIVKIEGKIEQLETKIFYEHKQSIQELRYEMKESLSTLRDTLRAEMNQSKENIEKDFSDTFNTEFERLQQVEPSSGLSGLIQSEHIMKGIGKVIETAGPELILKAVSTFSKMSESINNPKPEVNESNLNNNEQVQSQDYENPDEQHYEQNEYDNEGYNGQSTNYQQNNSHTWKNTLNS